MTASCPGRGAALALLRRAGTQDDAPVEHGPRISSASLRAAQHPGHDAGREAYFATPISRKYFNTPGWISSTRGAAATVFAAVVSQACAHLVHSAFSAPCSVR